MTQLLNLSIVIEILTKQNNEKSTNRSQTQTQNFNLVSKFYWRQVFFVIYYLLKVEKYFLFSHFFQSILIDFSKANLKEEESTKQNRMHKNHSAEFSQTLIKSEKFKENLGFSLNENVKFNSATSLGNYSMMSKSL